jgi:voltage-gated potassium channel
MSGEPEVATKRLENYEHRTSGLMLVLALLFIVLYAIEVLVPDIVPPTSTLLQTVTYVIWLSFAADLITRAVLAPKHFEYLLRHPLDVLAVIVPAFRALRVLRVLTAGQWLFTRGDRFPVTNIALAVISAVAILAFMGALAVLDAERPDPDANITSFGVALWWALVTMSTVGYGDFYPVTFTGRAVAVGLMAVGIGLLAGLAGLLAGGLIKRITGKKDLEIKDLSNQIESLRREIRQALPATGSPASHGEREHRTATPQVDP